MASFLKYHPLLEAGICLIAPFTRHADLTTTVPIAAIGPDTLERLNPTSPESSTTSPPLRPRRTDRRSSDSQGRHVRRVE